MIPPPSSATCALHRTEPAVSTCQRCGNFQCWDCSAQGTQAFCPSCRALVGVAVSTEFPFDRENQDGLFAYAWETFKREWLMLTLATLIFFGIVFGISMVGQVLQGLGTVIGGSESGPRAGAVVVFAVATLISTLLQNLASGVLTMGLVRVSGDALNGRRVDLAVLFSQLGKVGRYVLAGLIGLLAAAPIFAIAFAAGIGAVFAKRSGMNLLERLEGPWMVVVVFGALAILLVWVFALLPIYFVQYELALNDDATAWGAVKNAWRVGSGKRLAIFGWSMLSGLVMFGGMMCCGIGLLPGFALAQLVLTGAYLALRKGVELEG